MHGVVEETFEHHVYRILSRLRDSWSAEDSSETFEEWLWQNRNEVGEEFLGDVETWMGLAEAISKTEPDDD